MNKQQFLATFWLLLLFGSGLITGMVFGPTNAHGVGGVSNGNTRSVLPEERWVEHHRRLLTSKLDLSAEQLALIDPVYENSAKKLEEVRETMAEDIKEVIRENRRGLAKVLTPEQVKQFKEFQMGGKGEPQP